MAKISDYTEVTNNESTDYFVLDQLVDGSRKTRKTTLAKIADAIFGSKTDNNLPHYTGTPTAGTTAEAIGKASADSSITFTPADTSKVTLTSLAAYRNGAVLILNLYLNAVTSIPANSELRIGDFTGTNAGLGAISGVVINRADSGLLGSYCFTTGNQRLYTTMNSNVASGTNLYLTIVTFTV